MDTTRPQQETGDVDASRDVQASKAAKRHWWSKCPCSSGLRFGKCCGATGDDTCRYEAE